MPSFSLRRFHSLLFVPVLFPFLFPLSPSAPDNHPPTAVDDNYTVHGILYAPGNSMLENDTDPDNDALHLSTCGAVSHGILNCNYYYNSFIMSRAPATSERTASLTRHAMARMRAPRAPSTSM